MRTRIALTLFWLLWTAAVIPAHTRGIIQLPGCAECDNEKNTAKTPSCCAAKKHPPATPASKAANCAICELLAKIADAGSLDIRLLPLGLTQDPAPEFLSPQSYRPPPPLRQSRAPPLSASTYQS